MKYIVVSYYTKDTPYKQVMDNYLRASLEKFNIPHYIEEVDSMGNWYQNVEYKPKFLVRMLEKYDCPIVWLDADAQLLKSPTLFENLDCDIALHELDWNTHYNNGTGVKEILSGTLYLTRQAMDTVKKWAATARDFRWEQKALEYIINKEKIKFYNLPPEYCTIVTKENNIPNYILEPVVVHHQASRKYKRLSNY